MEDSTIIQDSYELQRAVVEIGNWQGLCENLKVDRGTMNRLQYSYEHQEYKKSDCLNSYFNQGDAVWEEVILAVAQAPLNNVGLARNIAQKYLSEPNQEKILIKLEFCT